MPKRRLYRETLVKEVEDETTEYLEGQRVEKGYVLYVTSAAVEQEGNNPDQMAFGLIIGTRFEAMEEERQCYAGIRWFTRKTHHFLAGESPAFRVEGGTSGDTIRGIMEGYYEKVE